MPSFIEKAVLTVENRSSSKLRAINRDLLKLHKTAGLVSRSMRNIKGPKITTAGLSSINKTVAAINRLTAAKKRANAIGLRSPRTTGGGIGGAGGIGGGGRGRGASGGGYYGGGNEKRLKSIYARYPANIPGVFNLMAGYTTFAAAQGVARTGAGAIGDRSRERFTQQMMGLAPKQITMLGTAAEKATAGLLGVTKTTAMATSRNLLMAGATAETVTDLTRIQLQIRQATASLLGEARAERFSEQAVKVADLAGKLDDPKFATKLLTAMGQAQLVAGRDFNFDQALTGFRNLAGQALTMNSDAMLKMSMIFEEQGRRGASGFRTLDRTLNTNSINKKDLVRLIAGGFRTDKGAVDAELFSRDQIGWITKIVGSKLDVAGISRDDGTAIKAFLVKNGFAQSSLQVITSAILKEREMNAAVERAKQIDFNTAEAKSRKNLVQASKMVAKQFENLTAATTPMLTSLLAPKLVDFAKTLRNWSRGDFANTGTTKALIAAAVGGVAYTAVKHPGAIALTFSALKLRGSASALSAAAGKLSLAGSRAGIGGGVVGGKGKKGNSGAAVVGGKGGFKSKVGFGAFGGGLVVTNELIAGRYAEAGNAFAGAVAGGLIGSLGGPVGALIGSTIGAEIGSSFKKSFLTTAAEFFEKPTKKKIGRKLYSPLRDKFELEQRQKRGIITETIKPKYSPGAALVEEARLNKKIIEHRKTLVNFKDDLSLENTRWLEVQIRQLQKARDDIRTASVDYMRDVRNALDTPTTNTKAAKKAAAKEVAEAVVGVRVFSVYADPQAQVKKGKYEPDLVDLTGQENMFDFEAEVKKVLDAKKALSDDIDMLNEFTNRPDKNGAQTELNPLISALDTAKSALGGMFSSFAETGNNAATAMRSAHMDGAGAMKAALANITVNTNMQYQPNPTTPSKADTGPTTMVG